VTDRDKSKEELVQRARSLTARAAAAVAVLAIAPAAASAAPGTATDDTVADFTAGAPGAGTEVVAPGSVQLQLAQVREEFNGTDVPASMTETAWEAGGDATVTGEQLSVNGARVDVQDPGPAGQVLEFSGSFSGAGFQHVGFGVTFEDGPWAMFSTFSGGDTVYARTATAAGSPSDNEPIPGINATDVHTYRIEWDATQVRYYVDGTLRHSEDVAIAAPMRPIVSDLDKALGGVTIDWLERSLYPASGAFTSRVLDSGKAATDWTTLTAASTGDVKFETRSGESATPDATWSDWAELSGADIAGPSTRYIQYRATLTSGAGGTTTPTLDSVSIAYNTDDEAPAATIGGVQVTGTTARVTFSSTAGDVARFECSLDGGPFANCASPRELSGLTAGSHTIAVRAIDRAGNAGSAVTQGFTVAPPTNPPPPSDTTAPKVRPKPRTTYVSNKGKFKVSLRCPGNETSCRIALRIRYRGKTVASKAVTVLGGTSKMVTLRLKPSAHTALDRIGRLQVTAVTTARDAAGNRATTQTRMRLRD